MVVFFGATGKHGGLRFRLKSDFAACEILARAASVTMVGQPFVSCVRTLRHAT
jgi:hypothetical protein